MRLLSEGTRLADRYTLVRRIGVGGMAEIWLARDQQAGSIVALKLLSSSLVGDAAARDRLHREWRINSRLMHPHIVRVFEFHDDPDGAFFSLQNVGGTDISVVAGTGLDNALQPLGLIADALRYAHGKGVVHGDIKASNILLDTRGAPYLIDFGVAGLPAIDTQSSGGSEINLSPQRRAGRAPSPADDIYSLGILICELISGAPPDQQRPVQLRSADGSGSPAAIVALVNRMLEPEPTGRPAAEEVAAKLAVAGFPPGPARIRPATSDVPLEQEAVESIRPVPRGAARPSATQGQPRGGRSKGLSPSLVYGGLAVLALLLFAVVFLLPEPTEPPDKAGSVPAQGADSAVADTAETAPSDGSEVPDDQPGIADDGEAAGFNENTATLSDDQLERVRAATDEALGDLLSRLERLRFRAVDRWGGQAFLDALNVYAAGDAAYLGKNYAAALRHYREAIKMLDPFFDRIEPVFRETLAAAREAFAQGDHLEAVRLYDLAAAITPGNAEAEKGLARARNLEAVMSLTDQGLTYEKDLELDAARLSFERALDLDAAWEPASAGLARVRNSIREATLNQRMTEGLEALAAGQYESARAAFNAAKSIDPQAKQAVDGLLQVDQEIRLNTIRRLEQEVHQLETNERWEAAVTTYRSLLEIDGDLLFAKQGLNEASQRVALHQTLQGYIDDPDSLSNDVTMQKATGLLLEISRIADMGPRLADQKESLSRLLKRAATPLSVQLVSDSSTDVSIYKVGRFGTFSVHELKLRPGVYVAVGSRPGFRDVRLEFRVAPEIEMKPIVVQCEEQI